jgi:microcystin-dependent protein
MDEFIGIIKLFAGVFVPENWALCDGALLPINGNQALFSIMGNTYGGDGSTTFALPDLRGRSPLGPDALHPSYIICKIGQFPSRS